MVPKQGNAVWVAYSLFKGRLLLEEVGLILGFLMVPSGTLMAEYIAVLFKGDFSAQIIEKEM